MIDDGEISLRPLSLRPGGAGNMLSYFGRGAGFGIRARAKDDPWEDIPVRSAEERIKYSTAFMESLREANTNIPADVPMYLPCFTTGDQGIATFNRTFQQTSTSEVVDDRDWRARPARQPQFPPGPEGTPSTSHQLAAGVSTLHKASKAYRPSAQSREQLEAAEKAVRSIKGILNKLTPDNFERLQSQLVQLVTSADILRQTISLIFEKAVAEPTFCALYALLCNKLADELSDFPPPEGEDKPMTFRRVLLNTCQDEFEGASDARKKVQDITDEGQRELQERSVRNRTLGNVRLISELYKKGLIMDRILHACVTQLLEADADAGLPHEENLEAICEILTLAGKKLSETPKFQKHLPKYLKEMSKFSNNKNVASRIRFLIRDVLDMSDNDWVPRRERFTAKKISEIRTEAQQELGVTVRLPQSRPQQPRMSIKEEEPELFPAPQKYRDDWKTKQSNGGVEVQSENAVPAASGAVTPAEAKSPKLSTSKKINPQDVEKKAKSAYSEYLSSHDKNEAILCIKELAFPEKRAKLVEIAVQHLFDCQSENGRKLLIDLLVDLCKSQVLSSSDLLDGLRVFTDQLEDLRLDVPKSPGICGGIIGSAIADSVLEIDALPSMCKTIEGGETRREMSLSVLQIVNSKLGSATLQEMFEKKEIRASQFLEVNEVLDPPDLSDVGTFLKDNGLSMLPV